MPRTFFLALVYIGESIINGADVPGVLSILCNVDANRREHNPEDTRTNVAKVNPSSTDRKTEERSEIEMQDKWTV